MLRRSVVFSTGLLVLWLVQVFIVDRRRYVVFSMSQVRVHNDIGEQEQVYDTGGIAFEKEQNDWFRRLFGFVWIVVAPAWSAQRICRRGGAPRIRTGSRAARLQPKPAAARE